MKTAQSSGTWYRRYHSVNSQCVDYDNFIFNSIYYWSLFDSPVPNPNNQTTTSITSFVDSFDLLTHYNSLQHLQTVTIPTHYKSQPTASPLHQRILLEARDLQHSLNQYNDKESLPPTIFTLCHNGELPIVIDTSASMSITPEISDFAISPDSSTNKSLGSLTTTKTKVSGD